MATDAEIIAQLDKPGAGLPLVQKLATRWYYGPVVAGRSKWEDNRRRFEKTTHRLLSLIEGLDEKQLAIRVLVPPQIGLEDSSRYWSAGMLFDHLIIVGEGMKKVILALAAGVVLGEKADVAKFKPPETRPPAESIAAYRLFAAALMDDIDKAVTDKQGGIKFRHPWLGPLNARQWQWVLGSHQGIHLQQLGEIVKVVKATP